MTGSRKTPYQPWDAVDHEDWCPAKPPTDRDDDECQCLRADVLDARSWARHGYEIGQRSCTWSDQGVAPAWLTEGHSREALTGHNPPYSPEADHG